MPIVPAPRFPSQRNRTTQCAVDRSRHPALRCCQHVIAAAGGADRRSARRRGRAVESIARSAPCGAAAPFPRGGMTWTDAGTRDGWGTRVDGVGTRVGTRVPTSVGFNGLGHGGRRAGTGRAAELASEAARAEGASLPLPPSVAGKLSAGRGPGQARSRQAAELAGWMVPPSAARGVPEVDRAVTSRSRLTEATRRRRLLAFVGGDSCGLVVRLPGAASQP